MSKPCIFCNKPGGSGEHLWSDALGPEIDRYLPKDARRSYKALTGSSGQDLHRESGMLLHRTTIPCVCDPCNNSWMNRNDERTRVKLIRLIRGQSATYSQQESRYLASWLAMKMIVRDEYKDTRSTFTEAEKSNFYLTGLPPVSMWIGLLLCGEPIWAGAFQRQQQVFIDDAGVGIEASYTMGLGATVVIVQHPARGGRPKGVPEAMVLQIWPDPPAFEWPATPRLSAAEVRKIAMRFNPAVESAGDVFGRAQYRVATGYAERMNRQQRRAKAKEG